MEDFSNMFFGARGFNIDIGGWDVSSATSMLLFMGDTRLNFPLSGWDVSNVKTFHRMFHWAHFNQVSMSLEYVANLSQAQSFDFCVSPLICGP